MKWITCEKNYVEMVTKHFIIKIHYRWQNKIRHNTITIGDGKKFVTNGIFVTTLSQENNFVMRFVIFTIWEKKYAIWDEFNSSPKIKFLLLEDYNVVNLYVIWWFILTIEVDDYGLKYWYTENILNWIIIRN